MSIMTRDEQSHRSRVCDEIARFEIILKRDHGVLVLETPSPKTQGFNEFSIVEKRAYNNICANVLNECVNLMLDAGEYAKAKIDRRRKSLDGRATA